MLTGHSFIQFVPVSLANANLVDPQIKMTPGPDMTFTLSAQGGVAPFTWLDHPSGTVGYFADSTSGKPLNGFYLVPGMDRTGEYLQPLLACCPDASSLRSTIHPVFVAFASGEPFTCQLCHSLAVEQLAHLVAAAVAVAAFRHIPCFGHHSFESLSDFLYNPCS